MQNIQHTQHIATIPHDTSNAAAKNHLTLSHALSSAAIRPGWVSGTAFFSGKSTLKEVTIRHMGMEFAITAHCYLNYAAAPTENGDLALFTRRSDGVYEEAYTGLLGGGKNKPSKKTKLPQKQTLNQQATSSSPQSASSSTDSPSILSKSEFSDLVKSWGFASAFEILLINVCTSRIALDEKFFEDQFKPRDIYKSASGKTLIDIYRFSISKLAFEAQRVNIITDAIVEQLRLRESLIKDRENPHLAERAESHMNLIKKSVVNMAMAVKKLKPALEATRTEFQQILNNNPEAIGAGKQKVTRSAQDTLVSEIDGIRYRYETNNLSTRKKMADEAKGLQDAFDAFTELKITHTPISANASTDASIHPDIYKELDPTAAKPLTQTLLQMAANITQLRRELREVCDIQRTAAESDIPDEMKGMADDIRLKIDREVNKLLKKNEDMTALLNDAVIEYKKKTVLISEKTEKKPLNSEDPKLLLTKNTRKSCTQTQASVSQAAQIHKECEVLSDQLAKAIKSKQDFTSRSADYYNITYGSKLDDMETSFKDLRERSAQICIKVDQDLEPLFVQARNHANNAEWTAAIETASKAAGSLQPLEKRVTAAENAKKQFETLSATAFTEAKQIKNSCDMWKLQDAGKELDALVNATHVARGSGDWIKASRALSKLDERCHELRSLTTAFDKYKADLAKPMLLQGKIVEIQRSLIENNEYTDDEFLDNLDKAYSAQCQIPRATWLDTLNISGHKVIELSGGLHITVFNDAISKNFETIDVRDSTARIASTLLFLDDVTQRVHVTKVVHDADGQAVHYHRYFDTGKFYSDNVNTLSKMEGDTIRKELDSAYDEMMKRFETSIDALRDNHGRTDV